MPEYKQVIVMRKDLKMRRGKEIAQGAHASMMWLCKLIKDVEDSSMPNEGCANPYSLMNDAQYKWLNGTFTKVTLQVHSEEELLEIVRLARLANLDTHVVTDAGKTEFNGVPTKTCCAIGPAHADLINMVTGHLKLY